MDGFCCIFAIDYGKELFKGKLGKNPETAGRAVYCWFVMLCEIADRVNISADLVSLGPPQPFSMAFFGHHASNFSAFDLISRSSWSNEPSSLIATFFSNC